MSQKYFVRLEMGNKSFDPTRVSTAGCQFVADFLEAVKSKVAPILDAYSVVQLSFFDADGTTEIGTMTPIADVIETKGKPFIVKVDPVNSESPITRVGILFPFVNNRHCNRCLYIYSRFRRIRSCPIRRNR